MCVTFTKAAAAEMANRLFERLSQWIALDDEKLTALLAGLGHSAPDAALLERARQLFTRALETPGGLRIQTIHAFCERVLQLFPVEAGSFRTSPCWMTASRASFSKRCATRCCCGRGPTPPHPIGAAVAAVAARINPDAFDSLLTQLLGKRAELRDVLDPDGGLAHADAVLRSRLSIAAAEDAQAVRAGSESTERSMRSLPTPCATAPAGTSSAGPSSANG